MKVLIVGGVAGGATAAARLRRLDEHAEIILLERGEYISFANCGLPYYIGGVIEKEEALTLQTPESFRARFGVDVRIGQEAVAILPEQKRVTIRDHKRDREYQESYDRLILSPGAEPLRPNLPGIGHPRIFTLRSIPDTLRIRGFIQGEQPRSAAVIGGGAIGMEMAENLCRTGLAVTVVEASDHVIGPLDYDMACEVHAHLRQKGVELRLNNGVKGFSPAGEAVRVELDEGSLVADMVLLSIGVRPETGIARDAGLALNRRGAVLVDEHMRTSQPDIYAVGDAVQVKNLVGGGDAYIPLAGPANKQGRIAADNICGLRSVYRGTQGTSVIRVFGMTVACTGLNEREARLGGFQYDKVFLFPASHATYYPGAENMSLKVLFQREDGLILGAQIAGFDGVDKRCDLLAAAVRGGLTAADLCELELCYAPPYSSAKDPVNMAGYVIENLLAERVRQYHWHEVETLRDAGGTLLLDVRTSGEYAAGHIDGAINIPLDELRERLDELDPGKALYVNCQSGLRSYLACRILTQRGYDCSNLAGGYRLYALIRGEQAPRGPCRHCGAPAEP